MHVLIICSGNTCRSPLAAAMLRGALRATDTMTDVSVASAGTSAWDGSPASEGSYLVALERGLDLSTHRARMLTTQQVAEADVILTMSGAHARRVADLGGAAKVSTLLEYAGTNGNDVPDPFGGDVEGYRAVAELMSDILPAVVERLRRERAR